MNICKQCGKELDDKAVVCVNCGFAIKVKKPFYKKWWFWVIVVIILGIAVGSGGGSDEKTNGTTDNSSQGDSKTSAVVQEVSYKKVDMKTMLDDLESNSLKAEKTYQDMYLEISGKIKNFDSDGSYITIEPSNADEWNFQTIMCNVTDDSQLDFLLEKSVGDTVSIKGQVSSVGEVLGYTVEIAEVY